jgi:hypothetical protein
VHGANFDGVFWAQGGNPEREIVFWEDFEKEAIIKEFYNTMKKSEELYK